MKVLVAHASKYGSTAQIARRIADVLHASGVTVVAREVGSVADVEAYDAFVVGSATYRGSWLETASAFVERNGDLLRERPVWLFSSGPLGSTLDDGGRDKRETTVPREIAGFAETIAPLGHRVFFGALYPARLNRAERLIRKVPAGRKLLVEGDFRDWDDIDAWARAIAREVGEMQLVGSEVGV